MTISGLSVATATDVGCKRKNNEDSFLSLPEYRLFCVADGMGGAREGQVASKAVTDSLSKAFSGPGVGGLDLPAKVRLVRETVSQTNIWIRKRIEERGFTQMGSTVVVGLFDDKNPSTGIVLHAGDSRMYRYRGRALKQLIIDHTLVAELGAKDEKALPAQFRGVVTKAVGLGDEVTLDETPFDILPEDLFFICSDGLTRMIPDKMLQKFLRQNEMTNVDALAELLVTEAKKAGGDDNITVIVIRSGKDGAAGNEASGAALLERGADEPETARTATVNPQSVRPPLVSGPFKLPVTDSEEELPDNDTAEGDTPSTVDLDQRPRGTMKTGAEKHPTDASRRPGSGVKILSGVIALVILTSGLVWLKGPKVEKDIGSTSVALATVQKPEPVVVHSETVVKPGPVSSLLTNEVITKLAPAVVPPVETSSVVAVAVEVAVTSLVSAMPPLVVTSKDEPVVVAVVIPKATESVVVPPVTGSTGVVSVAVAVASTAETAVAVSMPVPIPVKVAAKSKEDEEKESLEKARATLADMAGSIARSGKWGALRKELGPWWDKLAQVEPDAAKRQTLQGWMKLWDEASRDADSQKKVQGQLAGLSGLAETIDVSLPPRGLLEGEMADRANSLCRAYYEEQHLLLKGVESFATKQGQQVASLGEHLGPCITNLWHFLDGASSATDLGGISEPLAQVQDRAKVLKEWGQTKFAADIPIAPDQYPEADIKKIMVQADAAWEKLYVLIKPLDTPIGFNSNTGDEAINEKLGKINNLYTEIVRKRGDSSVRQWRNAANPVRIRDLLLQVSSVVTILASRANSSN